MKYDELPLVVRWKLEDIKKKDVWAKCLSCGAITKNGPIQYHNRISPSGLRTVEYDAIYECGACGRTRTHVLLIPAGEEPPSAFLRPLLTPPHDRGYCQLCGEGDPLSTHHKDHDHENDAPGNHVTLCYNCHVRHHRRLTNEREELIISGSSEGVDAGGAR